MSLCRVPGCDREPPCGYVLCKPHWYAVPFKLRERIKRLYRPGQRIETASLRYLTAMAQAVEHVARCEARPRANVFRAVVEARRKERAEA